MTTPTLRTSLMLQKFIFLFVLLFPFNFIQSQNDCLIDAELSVVNASLESPLSGPFAPDEELTIQLSVLWRSVDCNWLHGLVPTFGAGWAEWNFYNYGEFFIDDPLNDNIGTFNWYPAEFGQLKYQNNDSSEYGYNEPLPSGWYMTNTTSGPWNNGCGPADFTHDPNCSCGITQDCNTYVEYTMEFRLTTVSYLECVTLDSANDLSLQFKIFSDFESGAGFTDRCIDIPPITQNWTLDCGPDLSLHLDYTSRNIPNNGTIEIDIFDRQIVPNPNETFTWEVSDSDYVSGGTACNSACGNIFTQSLVNDSSSRRNLKFYVSATDEDGNTGPPATFNIWVGAELKNMADTIIDVCENSYLTIPIHILGGKADGDEDKYEYLWSNGETTENITVYIDEPTSYSVTITDDWGTISSTYTINSIAAPNAAIVPDAFEVACEGISPEYVSYVTDVLVHEHVWSGPGISSENENDEIIFPDLPGIYTLELTELETGCIITQEITVLETFDIEVSLTSSTNEVCRDHEPLDLFVASPLGGEFSGQLNADNHFIPDEIGVHEITYMVENEWSGCAYQETIQIEVIDDAQLPAIEWAHELQNTYCAGQTYTFCYDEITIPHTRKWEADEFAIVEALNLNCVNITWTNSSQNGSVCVEYFTNENCFSPKLCVSDIIVLEEADCSALSTNKIENNIKIYPNPTRYLLNVESSHKIESIQLFDLLGRLVLEKEDLGNTFTSIDVSELQEGIYQLLVDESWVQKLVIY